MELDYSKYGFVEIISKRKNRSKFFHCQLGENITYFLDVINDTHTLYWAFSKTPEDKNIVANRYEVNSQNELDFLILNSRVGTGIKIIIKSL